MKGIHKFEVSKMLFTTLFLSFIAAGIAYAQSDLPAFTGKFTLTNQVLWREIVLSPGEYTIAVGSTNGSTWALVRDGKGRPMARFMAGIDSGKKAAQNALFIKEKAGQLHVYSLAIASLGRVFIYDPVLAREAILEAHAPQEVRITLAKR